MTDIEVCSICTTCDCKDNEYYDWDNGVCK